MRRRDFIVGLGSAAAWPLAARAQRGTNPIIGYLSTGPTSSYFSPEFFQGLKESGYVEGQNVTIEYRSAENRPDALPALARELAARVTLIATFDTASGLAAKAATTTTPIVFATSADPVKIGLVANLTRPGGNVTGVTVLNNTLGSKRLGLLVALVPTAATFGFLIDPSNPNAEPETADMQAAADALGHKLVVMSAGSASEIDAALTKFVTLRVDALAVAAHAFFIVRRQQLAQLAVLHRLPTIFGYRANVTAGGLMAYSGILTEVLRQLGVYAARILRGEKPGDLPVQQASRFEFILNLTTAKTLGLTVPPGILAIADDVIE